MKNIKLMLSSVKRIVLFFVLMSFGLYATAQTTMEVSGTVKDDQGETVIGASVLEEGTTNGAVTDIDGNFKLKVKEGAKIRISYVGYNTVTLPARQNMVVKLEEAGNIMDELVVTGYTTQRKADLTGSVSVVSTDDLKTSPDADPMRALQGRVPGMTVTGNGSPNGNPILTADVPDFRDPHVFRHEKSGRWILILAAGQEMRIYSSANLKEWTYESSFGKGYGCHEGVWECPDLFELPVEGKNYSKWVLVCNINPGGPAGGSATQYFTGTFDGHKFTCDTKPEVTKWADYGKDNYAGVTFDNAPDGRRILIGWMSNWQYANQAPTQQYRSANTIARDLYLYTDGTTEYLASKPSVENEKMRGKAAVKKNISGSKTISKMFSKPRGTYEVVLTLGNDNAGNVELVLSNTKGENVSMMYDAAKGTLSFDRRKSGNVSFSDQFPAVSVAPVVGSKLNELRLYVDNCSVEAFANGGRSVMTNLVFPSEPYNSISVKCDGKKKSASLVVYPLNK